MNLHDQDFHQSFVLAMLMNQFTSQAVNDVAGLDVETAYAYDLGNLTQLYCKDVPVHWNIDEDCVNRNLNIGDVLGGFDPFVNNCQQFTQRVFRKCSKSSWPTPPPPSPSPAPSDGGCCKQ